MKKVVIIGIAIAVIIGVIGGVTALQNNSDNIDEISANIDTKNEPKSFTVGLDESVGFSESP